MYSGLKERMLKVNKLSVEQKEELRDLIQLHQDSINQFMNSNNVPFAVLNALEDRLIELGEAYSKTK